MKAGLSFLQPGSYSWPATIESIDGSGFFEGVIDYG